MVEKTPTQIIKMVTMYDPNRIYSITINPNDETQKFYTKDPIRNLNKYYINNYFYLWKQAGIKFNLYAEYSNGSKYRYHWHGTIQFNEGIGLWYSKLHNQMVRECNIDIDTIDDHELWKEYCLKNYKLMKKITPKYAHITDKNLLIVH